MKKEYTPRLKAQVNSMKINTGKSMQETVKIEIQTHEEKKAKFSIVHTRHSKKRTAQRGIDNELILLGQMYGKVVFKQGFVFYVVHDRDLPSDLDHKIRERLSNLVLVLNSDETELVTAYRSKNGPKHIRRKSKYLYKGA